MVVPFCPAQDFGVILHQPLNLSIFRKNTKNGRKMNGIPVSPCQKSENAPTWRPRKHNFRARFLPTFRRIQDPFQQCLPCFNAPIEFITSHPYYPHPNTPNKLITYSSYTPINYVRQIPNTFTLRSIPITQQKETRMYD